MIPLLSGPGPGIRAGASDGCLRAGRGRRFPGSGRGCPRPAQTRPAPPQPRAGRSLDRLSLRMAHHPSCWSEQERAFSRPAAVSPWRRLARRRRVRRRAPAGDRSAAPRQRVHVAPRVVGLPAIWWLLIPLALLSPTAWLDRPGRIVSRGRAGCQRRPRRQCDGSRLPHRGLTSWACSACPVLAGCGDSAPQRQRRHSSISVTDQTADRFTWPCNSGPVTLEA